MIEVDQLANEIRCVDGGNKLGAGALAEALMPFWNRPVSDNESIVRRYATGSDDSIRAVAAFMKAHKAEPENRWIHTKTGNAYFLMHIANTGASKPGWEATAVYQDEAGNVWSRPMAEFHAKFTKDAT